MSVPILVLVVTTELTVSSDEKGFLVCVSTRRYQQSPRQLDLQRVLSSRSLETVGIEMTVGSSGLHFHSKSLDCVHKNTIFTVAQNSNTVNSGLDWKCKFNRFLKKKWIESNEIASANNFIHSSKIYSSQKGGEATLSFV